MAVPARLANGNTRTPAALVTSTMARHPDRLSHMHLDPIPRYEWDVPPRRWAPHHSRPGGRRGER